jgi:hypothetical protein
MTRQSNLTRADSATLEPMEGTVPSLARDEAVTALAAAVVARAQSLTDELKRAAGDLAGRARGSAEKRLSDGMARSGERLAQLAEALRMTAAHLRERDDTELADRVSRSAQRLEMVSSYLQRRTLGDLLGDAAEFARRKPAVFLADAFRVGLLTVEFLSSRRGSNGRDDPGVRVEAAESSEPSTVSSELESRRERYSRPMWSDGAKTTEVFR